MPYWTLLHGTKSENVTTKPEKRDDGTVVAPNGKVWPKGTRVIPHDGDKPEMPRASVPQPTKKPKRRNPARSFGRDNTK